MLKLVKNFKRISILSLIACGLNSFAVQPENTINVLDFGATGDGNGDCSTAIQNAINAASDNEAINGVYFPVGTYKIANKVTFKSGVSLYGEDSGISLIKSDNPVEIGSTWGRNPVLDGMNVEDLFFKNVTIGFYAWVMNQRLNINVRRCVFVATSSKFDRNSALVFFGRTTNGSIQDCIFLRQEESPGAAIKTWHSTGLSVDRNAVGVSLANSEWLNDQWPGSTNWKNPSQKLSTLQDNENLKDNQGHYRKGFDASGLVGPLTISKNIFNGSEVLSTWKDHVLYIHNNDAKIVMTQNWMRGWPNTPNGGLKIRNNNGPFIIAANRFKNTPIYGYIHRVEGDATGREAQEVYIGTFVYRNIFDFTMDGPCYGGIGFWDQASEKGGLGVEENNEYAENILNTPNNTASFWFRSAEPSAHTIYSNNYHKNGTLVESSNQNIPFTIGVPDTAKTAPYANLVVPEYNIPLYATDSTPRDYVTISEDAHVEGGSKANNNYNNATMIARGSWFNSNYDRRVLMKVDLSSVSNLSSYRKFVLKFRMANYVDKTDTIKAFLLNNNSWSENTVTYNDIPEMTSDPIGSVTGLAPEAWVKIDITNAVKQQIASGNTTISFVLQSVKGYDKIYSTESNSKPMVELY